MGDGRRARRADSPGSDGVAAAAEEANAGADTRAAPVLAPIEVTSARRRASCSAVAVPAGGAAAFAARALQRGVRLG